MARPLRLAVTLASALAVTGAVHAAWNARRLRHLPDRPGQPITERVSVLIPARNEAANISDCLTALTAQVGVADLQILVGDDNSTDTTADLIRALADRVANITLIPIPEPGPGWLGKPNACAHLAEHADGTVLHFIDADVRLSTHAIATGTRELRTGFDLVSAWPRQLARAPLARLVQPLQQWSWLTTLPLDKVESSPRPELVAANGQWLICDRRAYDTAGGHSQVRDRVLDDIELAKAFKRADQRVSVIDASQVARCEMYATDREVVDGYAKSLWTAFGSPVGGLAVAGVLKFTYALPATYVLFGRHSGTRTAAAIGVSAGALGRVVAARATGGRVADSVSQPLSAVAFATLMSVSIARRFRGTLSWRGRPV